MSTFRALLSQKERTSVRKSVPSAAMQSDDPTGTRSLNFNNKDGIKLLYILMRRCAIANRVAIARTNLTLGRGFKIITHNDKEKKVLLNFLKNVHPTDPMTALLVKLQSLLLDANWSGRGWWEKRYFIENGKRTGIADIVPLHPLITDYKRNQEGKIILDRDGNPKSVSQKNDEYTEERLIPAKDVAQLSMLTLGDEILGYSVFEPAYKSYQRLMLIQEGVAMGVYRHGVPLHDITVGDELHPTTKPMIDDATEEVKGLNYMTEYVHPPWYKVQLLESFSLGNAGNYMDPYIADIITSSGLPEFVVLGKGENTNKAVAQEITRVFAIMIEPAQQRLKLFLESEILKPMMELAGVATVPTVQWNEILPEYPTDPVKKLKTLAEISLGGKALLTFEELREMAKLPTIKNNIIETLSTEQQGIYLSKPNGKLIHDGHKKAIVKDKNLLGKVGIPLYLVSGDLTYGIIKLQTPREINLKDFKKLQSIHRVSDDDRESSWPGKETLWYYPITIIDMFEKPANTKIPTDTKDFIPDVQFLKEWQGVEFK